MNDLVELREPVKGLMCGKPMVIFDIGVMLFMQELIQFISQFIQAVVQIIFCLFEIFKIVTALQLNLLVSGKSSPDNIAFLFYFFGIIIKVKFSYKSIFQLCLCRISNQRIASADVEINVGKRF